MGETAYATFAWQDGALCIRSPFAEMKLRWRPQPLAEELPVGQKQWRPFWPEFRLLRPAGARPEAAPDRQASGPAQAHAEQKAAAFAAFRRELPGHLVKVVEPFGSHQWALLALLHEQPRSLDLALGNPVLAYCLANNDEFRETEAGVAAVQAGWYSHRKQRAILQWLGFPGSEAMARLLRKIPPEEASPSILRRLGHAVGANKQVLELLAHLKVVNAGVLELVTTLQLLELVTPKLLKEVAQQPDELPGARASDILRSGLALLGAIDRQAPIRPFTRLRQVQAFQEQADAAYLDYLRRKQEQAEAERLENLRRKEEARRERQRRVEVAQRQRKRELERRSHRFPTPPMPGTPDIVPLASEEEMRAEGAEQSNCVATYVPQVMGGFLYCYRILRPERATLSIVRGPDGCWRRLELRARNNRPVKPETARCVDEWLARLRLSI